MRGADVDGRERPLVALRLASAEPLAADRIEGIARALDMPESGNLNFDPARGVIKRAVIENGRLAGIRARREEDAASGLAAHGNA